MRHSPLSGHPKNGQHAIHGWVNCLRWMGLACEGRLDTCRITSQLKDRYMPYTVGPTSYAPSLFVAFTFHNLQLTWFSPHTHAAYATFILCAFTSRTFLASAEAWATYSVKPGPFSRQCCKTKFFFVFCQHCQILGNLKDTDHVRPHPPPSPYSLPCMSFHKPATQDGHMPYTGNQLSLAG